MESKKPRLEEGNKEHKHGNEVLIDGQIPFDLIEDVSGIVVSEPSVEHKAQRKNLAKQQKKKTRKDPLFRLKGTAQSEDSTPSPPEIVSNDSLSSDHEVEVNADKAPTHNVTECGSSLDEISIGRSSTEMDDLYVDMLTSNHEIRMNRKDNNPGNSTITHETDIQTTEQDPNISSSSEYGVLNDNANDTSRLSNTKTRKISKIRLDAELEIIRLSDMLSEERRKVHSKQNEKSVQIAHKQKQIAQMKADIAAKQAEIAAKEADIAAKEAEIAAKEAEIVDIKRDLKDFIIETDANKSLIRSKIKIINANTAHTVLIVRVSSDEN